MDSAEPVYATVTYVDGRVVRLTEAEMFWVSDALGEAARHRPILHPTHARYLGELRLKLAGEPVQPGSTPAEVR